MIAEDYGFLASAVAGRRVSILASSRDGEVYTDGYSIFIPDSASTVTSTSQETAQSLPFSWLPIVAQAALIAAGSLDPVLMRHLVGRRDLARRYVYLEVVRANRVIADRLPWNFGLRPELDGIEPLSGSADESLELARSRRSLPATPGYFGTLRPLAALRRALREEGLSPLARRPVSTSESRNAPEFDAEERSDESLILRLFQNPLSAGNPISTVLNDILGASMSKTSGASGEGGAEMPVGRVERTLRRGVRAVLAAAGARMPEPEQASVNPLLCYPEWDVHRHAYRPKWVHVEEIDAWRADELRGSDVILELPPRELKRQLASLGLDHEMHRAQNEGADLDMGALIDCAIGMRTGHSPPSANVYRASRRTRRDLAVAIVLDLSGSTGESSAGDSVFKKQVKLAYQLALALDACGDAVALFGFHSWGRKLVRVIRLKGHEERWSGRVVERLRALEPAGYTRTGAAIRHGTRLLRERMRLPNRLLMLITDGFAYDQDYEQRYGECDTRKALQEATADGIACVALCVGSSTETGKLGEVFGAANLLVVDEVEQITRRILEVCRHALAAVSKRNPHRSRPASRSP